MRDSMDFETTPVEEDCEQCPYKDGGVKAHKEAEVFIRQLRRQFGECPSTRFRVKSNPHDGVEPGQVFHYLSVELIFDDSVQESVDYAYNVDGNIPLYWDEQARVELGLPPS